MINKKFLKKNFTSKVSIKEEKYLRFTKNYFRMKQMFKGGKILSKNIRMMCKVI